MIPLRVYVENFMSYREGQELLFDGSPLWVLAGANGAGKSTIFDAITFALYGLHRGGKQNVKDLINHEADALTVEFDFLVDGTAYRVRRTVPLQGRGTREVFCLAPSPNTGRLRIEPIADTDNDSGFKDWVKRTIGLNEDAFTSCVLLLQGQSEKLLTAKPDERYKILKQLIDLSAYEQLHEKADNIRKEYDAKVKELKRRFESEPAVSALQLQAAQESFNQANQDWQTAQIKVENLTSILQQSKQWEQLIAQLSEQQNELQKLHHLMARTQEIKSNFARFQELESVIPSLTSVIQQRERLVENEQQLGQLQQRVQKLDNDLDNAEKQKKQAEQQVELLAQEIEQLQKHGTDLTNRLIELAPLVEKLSQWEIIQAELNKREEQLASFPSDLAQIVKQAEKRDSQLAEIEIALPWLRQLTRYRTELADVLKKEKSASDNLEFLVKKLQDYQNQHETISSEIEQASEIAKKLSHEVIRTETEYKAVCQRRTRFEEVAHQPTCELCGQKITPEHAKAEKERLDAQIVDAQLSLNNFNSQYQNAQEHLNQLTENLKSLEQQLTNLKEKRNQSENQRNQAQRDADQFVKQVEDAFNNLPTTYQLHISPYVPRDEVSWINTTYPSEVNLQELSQEVNSRENHKKILEDLRQQLREWERLDTERQTYSQQLAEFEADLSIANAQQARSQQNDLQKAQQQLQSQLQERKTEQNQARNISTAANVALQQASQELQNCQIQLSKILGIKSEIKRLVKSNIDSLPEVWQERATTIDAIELSHLEEQCQELANYAKLSKELENVAQSIAHIEQQISNLSNQIQQLPQEAQRAAQQVEQELQTAKDQQQQADQTRVAAKQLYDQLNWQRQQRSQLEKDLREAERQLHLHTLLSNLLGKKGIQLQLFRDAERAIVQLANGILDGLSRGRMRLELRSEAEESGSESDKALDLVVYNYDTGHRPTAVALTSGSQRFRIAVSLALAIGQYAGQGTRRIESVIIDEGFGSLDKNGRDDMIHELNELQQQLARIILVSHQEEFSSTFANGYAVELVNGASKVSLLENA